MFFYTAGTRPYGMRIIDIFKLEIERLFGREELLCEGAMNHTLNYSKLISRDDKDRYESGQQKRDNIIN